MDRDPTQCLRALRSSGRPAETSVRPSPGPRVILGGGSVCTPLRSDPLLRGRKSFLQLISNNWKYSTHSPLCNYNSFESHAITVMAPIKLQIVVIYRPPGKTLATFLEELDGLLSSFMENGTPVLVFGDFNIHLEKPYATEFN